MTEIVKPFLSHGEVAHLLPKPEDIRDHAIGRPAKADDF